jgi:hypothetical protein
MRSFWDIALRSHYSSPWWCRQYGDSCTSFWSEWPQRNTVFLSNISFQIFVDTQQLKYVICSQSDIAVLNSSLIKLFNTFIHHHIFSYQCNVILTFSFANTTIHVTPCIFSEIRPCSPELTRKSWDSYTYSHVCWGWRLCQPDILLKQEWR